MDASSFIVKNTVLYIGEIYTNARWFWSRVWVAEVWIWKFCLMSSVTHSARRWNIIFTAWRNAAPSIFQFQSKSAQTDEILRNRRWERAKLESPATTEAPARCDTLITAPEKINTRRRRHRRYIEEALARNTRVRSCTPPCTSSTYAHDTCQMKIVPKTIFKTSHAIESIVLCHI